MDTDKKYRLRAHHGMCLGFFKGKGYSIEFSAHMEDILKALEKNPVVSLTEGMDDICVMCPNNQSGICVSQEKVLAYDKKVLTSCNLQAGDMLSWKEFVGRIKENIIESGKRREICKDCQWDEICR